MAEEKNTDPKNKQEEKPNPDIKPPEFTILSESVTGNDSEGLSELLKKILDNK